MITYHFYHCASTGLLIRLSNAMLSDMKNPFGESSPDVIKAQANYDWPDNIRELGIFLENLL